MDGNAFSRDKAFVEWPGKSVQKYQTPSIQRYGQGHHAVGPNTTERPPRGNPVRGNRLDVHDFQ